MIDTHCHLNDAKYDLDRGQVISNLFSAGVNYAICIGCDNLSNKTAKQVSDENANIYYTYGIHPDNCDEYDAAKFEHMLKTANNKLVAVGEIGLDYFHNKNNKAEQMNVFVSQIELANRYKLPIVIHCREAYGDTLEVLKQHPAKYGAVMHCFGGSVEYAQELVKLGVKMSFTGTVTFKNAKNVQQVAQVIPNESFFFETDSPYLSPEPHRGTRNEPKNVIDVAKFVADLRGVSFKQIEQISDQNAKSFFKIPK